ncbi:hypothetical protein SAY87_026866 [Trapa incisa]|uniref:Uncharacterized protein n=1 Tax=Trapa incisa TaxID=236973 RepID=A0AAN7GYD5_9MYRT|nr:hypothetical protein SAY87_026866 [Trapa incisa]
MNESSDRPNPTRPAQDSSSQTVHAGNQEPAQQRHLENMDPSRVNSSKPDNRGANDFKAVAADASVFTFGGEEVICL